MARKNSSQIIKFIKYSLGGAAYFVIAWIIITFGTKYIGLWWSNIIGNLLGILVNYLMQQFWAFGDGRNIFNSGWKFVLITAVNLVLSYYILKFQTDNGIPLWLAQFVSAGFFSIWNWLWYKYWVFRESK